MKQITKSWGGERALLRDPYEIETYRKYTSSKISVVWNMTPRTLVEVLRKFQRILLPASLGCMRLEVNVLHA